MKKIIITLLLVALLVPVLFAKVNYLSEKEYKKLKKKERIQYWDDLQNQLYSIGQDH